MNVSLSVVAWDTNGEQKTASDETVEFAVDRIRRLDGAARTVVMIEAENIQIGVGGGNGGRVIAYYTRDNWNFFNLVGDPNEKGAAWLVTGGQPGDFDRRNIVDIPAAASAVHELIDNGNPMHYLWEKQD
ncbi:Imm1 family immunity protein [Actinomyces israelii]|uniref:Imm1 family immunity protein n=1 Tax=Actinomyces israelii TaxID=1659 RepID=UPI002555B4FA|nr:Imm1 family immunity protein [Actinomyces israelii]WKR22384.1 hypothetical protein AIF0345_2333 [Actinomyces israelii]